MKHKQKRKGTIPYDNIDALQRVISGELRTTINAHGSIGSEQIGSATKRVAGQVAANFRFDKRVSRNAPRRPKAEAPKTLALTS